VTEGPWVGLADAVRGVRAELELALTDGADSEVRFQAGPVELEFAVDVRKDAAGGAGVKVWVISLDAKAGLATTNVHRMKLTLQPRSRRGGELNINSYE